MSMKKSFKQRMRENENDQKKGYDPVTNTWKPHKSVEKGTDTIAYGHKLKYHGEITSLTENQAIELFNKDYSIHEKNAAKIYDDFTGKKESFKKLETYKKEVFTDITFNVGNNAKNFKKFMTAMRDNDKNKMIEESKTYVNLEGKMKLLERRWKMRAEEINNSWRVNSQENQNINGVDLSYTLNHDKIIGFSYFNDAMSLIYSKDPRNLFDIKLSYLAAALWVEYKEDVLDSNIRFSLDPVGSVHMKTFYPECIKDT